jgi:hypothetical protein
MSLDSTEGAKLINIGSSRKTAKALWLLAGVPILVGVLQGSD